MHLCIHAHIHSQNPFTKSSHEIHVHTCICAHMHTCSIALMLFNVQYVMGGGWDLYTQSVNAFAGDRLTGEWKVTLLTLPYLPYLTCLTLPVQNRSF